MRLTRSDAAEEIGDYLYGYDRNLSLWPISAKERAARLWECY